VGNFAPFSDIVHIKGRNFDPKINGFLGLMVWITMDYYCITMSRLVVLAASVFEISC